MTLPIDHRDDNVLEMNVCLLTFVKGYTVVCTSWSFFQYNITRNYRSKKFEMTYRAEKSPRCKILRFSQNFELRELTYEL